MVWRSTRRCCPPDSRTGQGLASIFSKSPSLDTAMMRRIRHLKNVILSCSPRRENSWKLARLRKTESRRVSAPVASAFFAQPLP